jgi:hypothetical protein
MMLIAFAVAVSGHGEFGQSMNRYLACLSAAGPSETGGQDLESRSRAYRKAAARCVSERQAAIEAAVHDRQLGVSEAQARAQAIDIIDTLDPRSSCKIPGAQC